MVYLISYVVLMTILFFSLKEEIILSAYYSNFFGKLTNNTFLMYLAILIMPWLVIKFVDFKNFKKQKINMKFKARYVIIPLLIIFAFFTGKKAMQYYNESVKIAITFNSKMNERLSILDRITKIPQQTMQVAKINDSSYYKNVLAIMSNRADGPSLMWKWLTENNPNANYREVSVMYQQVINSINSERDKLLSVENQLSEIDKQYTELHTLFPSNILLFYEAKKLNYKAISTLENKEINLSGIDSNIHLK